jgi:hypothetical protein
LQRLKIEADGTETQREVLHLVTDTCSHPGSGRRTDPETTEVFCGKCGIQIQNTRPNSIGTEQFGRGTINHAVFRKNLGTTTKQKDEHGAEHHHLQTLSSVYGSRDGSQPPLERLTKTCPACRKEKVVRVFGESVKCDNAECGIELGHFVLRWLPYIPQNGGKKGTSNKALRYLADLRILQLWDPPEDDPTMKMAREVFRKKVLGHISDGDADFLAKRFLRGVKQLSKVYRKDVKDLLNGLLEGEGITIH